MMRHANKETRKLARRLTGIGCEIRAGGKHPKVYYEGRFVGILSGTPGDHRTERNIIRDLRAGGVPV